MTFNRRKKYRGIIEWILTRILLKVTLSATIQCRRDLSAELRRWVIYIYIAGFALGASAGAIGAVLALSAR